MGTIEIALSFGTGGFGKPRNVFEVELQGVPVNQRNDPQGDQRILDRKPRQPGITQWLARTS